jgi:hypothetical protein
MSIMKSRQQEFSQKAHEEHRRCCDWLLRFMKNKHPKFLTKSELRAAAIRKFNMSKNSFDFAWIDAIEEAGRHDADQKLNLRCRTLGRDEPFRDRPSLATSRGSCDCSSVR